MRSRSNRSKPQPRSANLHNDVIGFADGYDRQVEKAGVTSAAVSNNG